MDDNALKLLAARHTIILPDEINHDVYMMVAEAALLYPDNEITLLCRGSGGDMRCATSIIDIIRYHGRFVGLLPGMSYSSHVDIWLACAERYCYKHSGIGIHGVSLYGGDSFRDTHYHRKKLAEGDTLNVIIAVLLSENSNKDVQYWMDMIEATGDAIHWLYADEIISLGIAELITERPVPVLDKHGKSVSTLDGQPVMKSSDFIGG